MDHLTFKMELLFDYDQKKAWKEVTAEASRLYRLFRKELMRQHDSLGFVVARNFFTEREELPDSSFPDYVVRHVAAHTHDMFDPSKKNNSRFSRAPILLDKGQVHFSLTENVVRLPHLGAVRYRKNKRFSTKASMTENQQWLSSNVSSMILQELNNKPVLIVDCTDEEDRRERLRRKKERRSKKKSARASATARKWLGSEDEPE